MNTAMWNHPVTSEHLERITKWGYTVIEPISKGNLFDHDLEVFKFLNNCPIFMASLTLILLKIGRKTQFYKTTSIKIGFKC